jgi:hypothetical protein
MRCHNHGASFATTATSWSPPPRFFDHSYCLIDGSTAHDDRIVAIDEYNKPDSDKFIFLLTTR